MVRECPVGNVGYRNLILLDPLHFNPEPSRKNETRKVVYELRRRWKTKANRRGPRCCDSERCEAYKFRWGVLLYNHIATCYINIRTFQFRNFKIVYRRYAGLYFCICVDVNDNNLCYLEAIHNFVEVLNEYFHNVCELDLVFNFYKVYTVVDEMFLAGEIRETSQTKVLKQLLMLNSLE